MFRFTIRDVLWLMVVGLACGWGMEHWRLQEEISRGFSIRLRDREDNQRQRDALKTRIVRLEKSLVDAGVQVPQEPPGMTIGALLDALETAGSSLQQKTPRLSAERENAFRRAVQEFIACHAK